MADEMGLGIGINLRLKDPIATFVSMWGNTHTRVHLHSFGFCNLCKQAHKIKQPSMFQSTLSHVWLPM